MLKKKTYDFINQNSLFQKFIYALIILNVLSLILASYKEIYVKYELFFENFELFSVVIFSTEYILRFWTADLDFEKGTPFSKRLKFSLSSFGLIDLFAILPFYLPLLFPFDLRVLRILRLFRLLRIFKLGRLSKSLQTITSVLKESKSELSITLFVAFILMILSSTLMYYVENEAQPDKFENIGQSLWWSVATLTTVGYGDIYPITGLGKILSSVIALIGIGFVALPTGIISSAFISRMQKDKENGKECECPNCGTKF
ncbi:Ion transport domain containing protein [Flavobacteriaceae bacterium]